MFNKLNRRYLFIALFAAFIIGLNPLLLQASPGHQRPNIILIMTDDQGWGQTGYYNHPVLNTPNLDKMAENGLRLDRFYAGAPVCYGPFRQMAFERTPRPGRWESCEQACAS